MRHLLPTRRQILLGCWALLLLSVALGTAQEQHAPASGRFRVAGTVMNLTGGHPLAGTRVTLANTRNRQDLQTMVTGDNGHFEFSVAAGKYSLEAAKRGFITTFYMQHQQFSTAIVTGAGLDTENLVLRIAPTAVISGKVFDENGEPVRNATVRVFREDRQLGTGQIRPMNAGTTDDLGAYEIAPLDDGTYFVSVRDKPWYATYPRSSPEETTTQRDSSLDVAYPLIYYADATESEDATPIPVRGGDHVEIDFHLHAVPSLHLMVHMDQDVNHGFSPPSLTTPSFDGMMPVQPDNVQMISPGVFELTGVPAGRYFVRFRDPATGAMREPTEVELGSSNQELNDTAAGPATIISAKVTLRDGGRLPEPMGIVLRNAKDRFVGMAQLDGKGEANFQGVAAGTYRVLAGSERKVYSVTVSSESGQETGNLLEVPAGTSLKVSFSLVGGNVTVSGIAKRSGNAASGAMIVLVPKDPDAHIELFRRDQSDQDGTFSLPNVVPGSYTIIAIDDGWDLDWAKPAVIARYAEHGQRVVVTDQMRHEMQLPDAVEIQTK